MSKLFPLTLLFYSLCNIVTAQTHIMIFIDKNLTQAVYENGDPEGIYTNLPRYLKDALKSLPADNAGYSTCLFDPATRKLLLGSLLEPQFEFGDLVTGASVASGNYSDALDMIRRVSEWLRTQHPDLYFDSTFYMIVNLLANEPATSNDIFNSINRYNKFINIDLYDPTSDDQTSKLPINISCYKLALKQSPFSQRATLQYQRMTMADASQIQLRPTSTADSIFQLSLPLQCSVTLLSCAAFPFVKPDSDSPLPGHFSSSTFLKPATLGASGISATTSFPFYNLLKSLLVLDSLDPVIEGIDGKIMVRYQYNNPYYSQFRDLDTLSFRLAVDLPLRLQNKLGEEIVLDNARMVQYAKHQSMTQDEIAKELRGTITKTIYIAMAIALIMMVLSIWFIYLRSRRT